jgi:hypothetical protein
METLKKIVRNQYFPAAAVLIAVLLFWAIGLVGGLSMLNDDNPPIATLTWMLFVYMAAVLTPLAGVMAAVDLVRRWRRNRQYEQAHLASGKAAQEAPVQDNTVQDRTVQDNAVQDNPAQVEAVQEEPVQEEPAQVEAVQAKPAQAKPAQAKPALNRPAQAKPGQTKAARKKAA